jgi:glutamate-ammonia-ligase adenylyltransferase
MFYNMLPTQEEKELDPIMVYLLEGDQESGKELLASLGFKNPTRAFNILLNYVQGSLGVSLSSEERRQFYELLPQMVKMMASTPDPDETLNNFDKFFSNPTGRRVILSSSKEDFRTRLCKVFSLSSYLSTLISRNPDLVEDVLTLYQDYPDQNRLEEEFEKCRERLSLSPENLFRRFKTVWEVRNALVYLVKQEDRYTKLEKFFLSLSELADFLMKKLWQFSDGVCLYALGKYGSQELTIGSDLDLVFVARSPSFEEVKLAQQMIRFITLHTSEGYLYKLDFRLRPMGSKGELLPSIDFYRDYFEKNARTWERIAWTRARFIVGDTALRDEFEEVIENFLFSKPITEREIREIRDMRFTLESNAKKDKELIDIKFGKGGLIDGEFLIQLYTLREKLREPSMIRAYRILAQKHSLLKEAFEIYMFLRLVETRHRLSKEHGGSVLNKKDRERVASSINMSFEDFEDKLRESLKRMREIFLEVFEV